MIAVAVCVILVWVLVEDVRHFRVRNSAVIILAVCFPLDCILRGRLSLITPHVLFAAVGFAVLVGAFVLRMVGGGDAKLLAAALLWVGPEGCFVFALALLACTMIYATGAWCGLLRSRRVGGRTFIPFGPSIAVAWMTYIGLVAWIEVQPGGSQIGGSRSGNTVHRAT